MARAWSGEVERMEVALLSIGVGLVSILTGVGFWAVSTKVREMEERIEKMERGKGG